MLNLRALTLAVVVGMLSPVMSMSVLYGSQVVAQTQDERKAEADRWLKQGQQQLKSGEYQAALQSFKQAYAIYREISDSNGMSRATFGTGYAYAFLGEIEKATEIFEWFLKVAQENNNPELEKFAQQGLQFVQNQNNPQKAKADQLLQQGIQQFNTSQFREALQSWQQALDTYRAIGDSPEERLRQRRGEGYSLGNLGSAYRNLGQYYKAVEFLQQSLAIAREIGDRNGFADSLDGLGLAYLSLGQYQKAIEFYQQSLSIAREIGDPQGEASSLGGLGNAYRNLGQYHKAIEYYQQS